MSNTEHLLVFKALRGDNLEQNAVTIHTLIPEHLLLVKALRGDDPTHNAGTINASNPADLLVLRVPSRTIWNQIWKLKF